MSIYINKDELLKEFDIAQSAMELHGQEFSSSFLNAGQEISTEWFCVEEIVDYMPTIEIIHCKDCKNCAIYHHSEGDISVCARMYQFQRVLFDVIADKDFCSKAERRDAER